MHALLPPAWSSLAHAYPQGRHARTVSILFSKVHCSCPRPASTRADALRLHSSDCLAVIRCHSRPGVAWASFHRTVCIAVALHQYSTAARSSHDTANRHSKLQYISSACMASAQDDAEDIPRVVVKRYRKRTCSESQHPPRETSHTTTHSPAPLLRSTPRPRRHPPQSPSLRS